MASHHASALEQTESRQQRVVCSDATRTFVSQVVAMLEPASHLQLTHLGGVHHKHALHKQLTTHYADLLPSRVCVAQQPCSATPARTMFGFSSVPSNSTLWSFSALYTAASTRSVTSAHLHDIKIEASVTHDITIVICADYGFQPPQQLEAWHDARHMQVSTHGA